MGIQSLYAGEHTRLQPSLSACALMLHWADTLKRSQWRACLGSHQELVDWGIDDANCCQVWDLREGSAGICLQITAI